MGRLDELRQKKDAIYEIARKRRVNKLYVFGSTVRREDTPESDVDFLAEFLPNTSLFQLIILQEELHNFLGCNVDLVSRNGIHPLLKDQILKEAQVL